MPVPTTYAIAFGNNGQLVLSTNAGTSWSPTSSGFGTANIYAGTIAGAYVSLVGQNGNTSYATKSGPTITAFTAQSTGSSQDLYSVTYGLTQTVAVGAAGQICNAITPAAWNVQTIGSNTWRSVSYRLGIGFIAVGDNGAVTTSTNGIAWTAVQYLGSTSLKMIYSAELNKFIIYGSNNVWLYNGSVFTDTHLSNVWPVTSTIQSVSMSSVGAWTVGTGGVIAASTDLSNWLIFPSPFSLTSTQIGVIWSGAEFFALDSAGTLGAVSLASYAPYNSQEITTLVPTVNHGWYYIQDKRWYLYSDSYQAEVVSGSNTVSGYQVHTLKYSPKLATPIEVFNFIYNQKTQTYQKDIVFQKTIAFTNSGITPEFTLSGQVVSLNGVYTTTIGILGSPLTYENLGTRNGNAGQTFHTNYSPLDKSTSLHLYVSTTSNGLIDLTAAIGSSIIVDYDLGTVQFINADSYIGGAIFLYYGVGINIFYEPKNTTNTITATTASVNPALDGIGAGFIQVSISDRNISNV
jgi:hypothetical protein